MKEIETKFFVRNFREIIPRLKQMGANLDWKGTEVSSFYDTPDAKLRGISSNLRLREWTGHSITMTLKTKPPKADDSKYKARNEYQIEIDNLKTAEKILENLGFRKYLLTIKKRQHWKLGKISVELDTMKGHNIVEIEAAPKKIEELANKLGLDWKNSTTKSYIALWRELSS